MYYRPQSVFALILAPVFGFLFTFPTATALLAQGGNDVFLPFISSIEINTSGAADVPSTPPPVRDTTCQSNNANENIMAEMIVNDSGQQRDFMVCNPILAQVARERAIDMATRRYFGHTNPDGVGPNALVRSAGYGLPGFYSTAPDANNIESIAAGYTTAQSAFDGWSASSGHRVQILGEQGFYRDQVEYGIGYYYDANSEYKHYWVFLSAYEE